MNVIRARSRRHSRRAFALLDTLIVVAIMAILAGAAIPHYEASHRDAMESSLKHNLATLQSLVELYRATHLGRSPKLLSNSLPQLLNATNEQGEIGPSGPAYPLGPYMVVMPPNAFDQSDKVIAVAVPGSPPTGVVGSLGGWQYDELTGQVWPNNIQYYQ